MKRTRSGFKKAPRVSIVMGSESDLNVMRAAADTLDEFGVAYEVCIVSAHRTPKLLYDYAATLSARSIQVVIAGAGGAAHLPGMVASLTEIPVIGVPVPLKEMQGLDSLLSIAQMPAGVPVATVAVGNARNAGILATQILAFGGRFADEPLQGQLVEFKDSLRLKVVRQAALLKKKSLKKQSKKN